MEETMKPPRVYTHGILHLFGEIRRSSYLRQGYGRSDHRIHPRTYIRGLLRRRIKFWERTLPIS